MSQGIREVNYITRGYLLSAEHIVNERFNDNVIMEARDKDQFHWLVSLHVRTPGLGSLYTRPSVYGKPHAIHSVCWHVQNEFFRNLPDFLEVDGEPFFVLVNVAGTWIKRADNAFPVWMTGPLLRKVKVTKLCTCEQTLEQMIEHFRP